MHKGIVGGIVAPTVDRYIQVEAIESEEEDGANKPPSHIRILQRQRKGANHDSNNEPIYASTVGDVPIG